MFTWEVGGRDGEVPAGQRDGRRGLDRLVAPMRTPCISARCRSSPDRRSRTDAVGAAPARPSRGLRLAHPVGEPERSPAGASTRSTPTRWRRRPRSSTSCSDQGEPEFDHSFGTFPKADGVAERDGLRATASAHPRHRGTGAGRPAPLLLCALAAWNQGEMDGSCRGARPGVDTQLQKEQPPNYWHWARQNVLFDNFFASAQGCRSRTTCSSIAATSGAPTTTAQDSELTHGSNMFGAIAAADRGRVRQRGAACGMPQLRLPHRGRPAEPRRIPWAQYVASEEQKGTSGRPTRPSGATACTRNQAAACSRRRRRERHPRGLVAAGHVDHAPVRAVRASEQQLPRRELDHEGDRRDHALADVGVHRDLPHVGRLRRLLRPRPAAAVDDFGFASASR